MSVIEFQNFCDKQKLRKELKEWQTRLRLCYEFEWKDPCESICKSEIKRIKEIIGEDTIFDKIANLS